MIPLDITDEVVLRRTLEEIEASIPKLAESTRTTEELASVATSEEIVAHINQLSGNVNLIIAALDRNNQI